MIYYKKIVVQNHRKLVIKEDRLESLLGGCINHNHKTNLVHFEQRILPDMLTILCLLTIMMNLTLIWNMNDAIIH